MTKNMLKATIAGLGIAITLMGCSGTTETAPIDTTEQGKLETAVVVDETSDAEVEVVEDSDATSTFSAQVTELTGAQLNRLIAERTGVDNIPAGLNVLDDMELRFTDSCEATKAGVEAAVEAFLG